MADAASFDITSPVDFAEVDNALNQARKSGKKIPKKSDR